MNKILISFLLAAFLLFTTILKYPKYAPENINQSFDNEEMLVLLYAMEDTITEVKNIPSIEQMKFHINGNDKVIKIYLTVTEQNDLQINYIKNKVCKIFQNNVIANGNNLNTLGGGGYSLGFQIKKAD